MEDLNLEAKVIRHFSFLALASGKPRANFTFPTYISVLHLSTFFVSFYYLAYFYFIFNFITLKILYFYVLHVLSLHLQYVKLWDHTDQHKTGFPTQKLCKFK